MPRCTKPCLPQTRRNQNLIFPIYKNNTVRVQPYPPCLLQQRRRPCVTVALLWTTRIAPSSCSTCGWRIPTFHLSAITLRRSTRNGFVHHRQGPRSIPPRTGGLAAKLLVWEDVLLVFKFSWSIRSGST